MSIRFAEELEIPGQHSGALVGPSREKAAGIDPVLRERLTGLTRGIFGEIAALLRSESFKNLLIAGFAVSLSLFYLGHLVAFIFVGRISVGEPNKVILAIEIAQLAAVTAFGVKRGMTICKKRGRREA